jgi:hypothetical protein
MKYSTRNLFFVFLLSALFLQACSFPVYKKSLKIDGIVDSETVITGRIKLLEHFESDNFRRTSYVCRDTIRFAIRNCKNNKDCLPEGFFDKLHWEDFVEKYEIMTDSNGFFSFAVEPGAYYIYSCWGEGVFFDDAGVADPEKMKTCELMGYGMQIDAATKIEVDSGKINYLGTLTYVLSRKHWNDRYEQTLYQFAYSEIEDEYGDWLWYVLREAPEDSLDSFVEKIDERLEKNLFVNLNPVEFRWVPKEE